jgi:hypothetical protein
MWSNGWPNDNSESSTSGAFVLFSYLLMNKTASIELINRHSFLTIFLGLFFLAFTTTESEAQDNPFELEPYPFVNQGLNQLVIPDSSLAYQQLFNKFTEVGLKGSGKVRIVHIGDSHLQADFFSGHFRKRLQTFFLGAMGGRGFIFPYKVAGTNNPLNYSVSSTGVWESCRNVEKERNCELGLSGISIKTLDTNASIQIKITDQALAGYDFDRLMVFHTFGTENFALKIKPSNKIKLVQAFPEMGYTLFEFNQNLESVTMELQKQNETQKEFTLYGLNFDSNDPGIIYHTVGVNGAQYESYLKCDYFVPHLKVLNPDWIIVSLGTNDSYTNVFDTTVFIKKVDSLLQYIKQAAPNAAVLLTTPGDHRIKRVQVNAAAVRASEIIKKQAEQKQLAYWDFYSLMGGAGSMDAWRAVGLAHTDYLHFTQKGYEYQAQLLFVAFLKAYDDYMLRELQLKP